MLSMRFLWPIFTLCLLALPAQASWQDLPAPTQKALQQYQQQFQQARSVPAFYLLYRQAQNLAPKLAEPFQRNWEAYQSGQGPEPDLKRLSSQVPGLSLEIMAEGTTAVWLIAYTDWKQLAQRTLGQADDHFVALMQALNGPVETGYRAWMTRTWDYGGCSNLGSGVHTRLLLALRAELKTQTPFVKDLSAELSLLQQDLLTADSLCQKRQKALTEIQQLLQQLPPADRLYKPLQQRLNTLQSWPDEKFAGF